MLSSPGVVGIAAGAVAETDEELMVDVEGWGLER